MTQENSTNTNKSDTALVAVDELPRNGKYRLERGSLDLLICAVNGEFFVFENQCSHQREPLHQGRIRDGCLYCPYHGARFELSSGQPRSAPATEPIRCYPSRIVDRMLEILL